MIAAHYQIDFSEHYLADYMATRGIGFLGWNTRFRGFESSFMLDHALVDIGVGVRWLREVQGMETIVLLGNSGGGSLMAAYQAQARRPTRDAAGGDAPRGRLDRAAPRRRIHRQRGASRPARRAHRLDGCLGDRRKRPAGNRSRSRPVRHEERSALQRRFRRTATGRHRSPATTRSPTGPNRAETCARRRFLRPPVHGDAHLGGPPNGRPHARAQQAAAEHVLRR